MITWHGVPSSEAPVVVEHPPGRIIPKRKMEVVEVPGRNGDVIISQDAFESVEQTYEVHIPSGVPDLALAIRGVIDWLCYPGYNRLEDSYEPEVYRIAYYEGDHEIENILNRAGKAEITFMCKPERWLKIGEVPIVMTAAGSLVNPTNRTAKPLITVQGSGAGVLTVGSNTTTLTDCNGIVLDCDYEDAYRNSVNMNSTVTGDFPTFAAGVNNITWSGGITGLTIVPRWWTL